MREIKTVLLTTDFSETAKAALPWARAMAARFGAHILLVHVHEDRLPPFVVEYGQTGFADVLERQRKRATELLAEFAKEVGGDVEALVVDGMPHVEIVRVAEERRVDLIVMATHGRGFISHALMGSTTERVLRRAPCPVLAVRDRPAKEGAS
jgi:nucleotide-binding universal stress UspA family protein